MIYDLSRCMTQAFGGLIRDFESERGRKKKVYDIKMIFPYMTGDTGEKVFFLLKKNGKMYLHD